MSIPIDLMITSIMNKNGEVATVEWKDNLLQTIEVTAWPPTSREALVSVVQRDVLYDDINEAIKESQRLGYFNHLFYGATVDGSDNIVTINNDNQKHDGWLVVLEVVYKDDEPAKF